MPDEKPDVTEDNFDSLDLDEEGLQKLLDGSEEGRTDTDTHPEGSPPEGEAVKPDGAVEGEDAPPVVKPDATDPPPVQTYTAEQYQEAVKQRDQLAQAWDEFGKNPRAFISRYPAVAAALGMTDPAPGGQPGPPPPQGVPQRFVSFETAKRQEEDARLENLRKTDVDAHEREQIKVDAARAARQGRYEVETEAERTSVVENVQAQATKIVNDFVKEFRDGDQNFMGRKLTDEEILKVVDHAIATRTPNMRAACFEVFEKDILSGAQRKGATQVVKDLKNHESVTDAGKGKGGAPPSKPVEITEEWLDNATDEQIQALTPQQRNALGLM